MEEAIAYKRLLEVFELTHNEVADAVGKSRTTVSNLLRLNNLNDDVKILLEQGDIDMGHGRSLLSCSGSLQSDLAKEVVKKGLTVRETERLVKKSLAPVVEKEVPSINEKEEHLIKVLQDKLGLSVTAKTGKQGAGKLVINYKDLTDLDALISIIK